MDRGKLPNLSSYFPPPSDRAEKWASDSGPGMKINPCSPERLRPKKFDDAKKSINLHDMELLGLCYGRITFVDDFSQILNHVTFFFTRIFRDDILSSLGDNVAIIILHKVTTRRKFSLETVSPKLAKFRKP